MIREMIQIGYNKKNIFYFYKYINQKLIAEYI